MDGKKMGPLGLLKKLNLRKLSVAAALLIAFFATPLSQALAWESTGAPVSGQIDLPRGATDIAQKLYSFHQELLIIITAITILVFIHLTYNKNRNHKNANPVPSRTTHNFLIE